MRNNENITANSMVFRIKADFLKSLARPARLAIVEHLRKKRELSVGQMVNDLRIEQSGLSKHLVALRQAGILTCRQERTTVYYSIKNRDIFNVLRPIAEILRKRLKESEHLLNILGKT
ncbi:ArsR/SmtB family transcription factor [Elusimicrobiota bacterium]